MSEQPRRINKSLLLRIGAVGLFVCLGTFAVMHSLQSKKNTEPSELAENQQPAENQDSIEADAQTESSNPTPLDTSPNKISPVAAFENQSKPPESDPRFQSTSKPGFSSLKPQQEKPPSDSAALKKSTSQLLPPPTQFSIGDSKAQKKQTPPAAPVLGSGRGSFVPVRNASSQTKSVVQDSTIGDQPFNQPKSYNFQTKQTPKSTGFEIPPLVKNQSRDPGSPVPNAASPRQGQPINNPAVSLPPPLKQSNPTATGGFQTTLSDTSSSGNPAAKSTTNLLSNAGQFGSQKQSLPPLRPTNPNTAVSSAPKQNNSNLFANPPYPRLQNDRSLPIATQRGEKSQLNPQQPVDSSRPPIINRSPTPSASLASELAKPTPGERQLEGVQLPALALQKIAPREVQVNRPATFETIVKNTGKVPAREVILHDFVPTGTELIQAIPAPTSNAAGRLQWNLGTLNPGQQLSIKMELMPLTPGNIGSVGHLTFGTQASGKTICTKPELSVRHQAPESVLIGQEVVFDIFVENKGSGAAENVILQEDVPDGLQFANGQKELEYEIGTLRPGETRNVRLKLKATKVGQVQNVLVAHGAGKLQANDQINLRIVAPDLALTGEGPSRKYLERQATHLFHVANQGTAPATNMRLVARLPRGLRFVEANNQGQYDAAAHAVVWRLAKLDPQKNGSVTLTTMPIATGQQNIEVEAVADLDQRQTTRQSMVVEQLAELFFDIDDVADPIEIGAGTSYKVRVVNQGQKTATNVRIQVDFPPAIQPLSVEGASRHQIRGQTVMLEPIPAFQPGQEISFIVQAKGLREGDHRTVVSVRSDDRDIDVSKEESTHVYSDR